MSLEDKVYVVHTSLIPALIERPPPNDHERKPLTLPVRFGGLALANPMNCTVNEYPASAKSTQPLSNSILEKNTWYDNKLIAGQLTAKTEVAYLKKLCEGSEKLKSTLPSSLQRVIRLAKKKEFDAGSLHYRLRDLVSHYTKGLLQMLGFEITGNLIVCNRVLFVAL